MAGRRTAARAPASLLVIAALAGCIAVGMSGCAKSSDVEKLEQENRVQDARIKALEDGVNDAVQKQIGPLVKRLEELQRALDARYAVLNDRLEGLASEQGRISEEGESNRSQIKRTERHLDEYAKGQAVSLQEQANEVDKLRLRVQDVDRLLKSPIADLPAVTEADKLYREAHFLMISGQLDLAADKFGQFVQTYPQDKRRPEALLRQGQSYFMMRKYDFSLAPLYELLDKHAGAKSAIEGKWYIARALEETGDLKLARDFYAQLIAGKTVYAADASRRVALIQRMFVSAPPQAPAAGQSVAPPPPPTQGGEPQAASKDRAEDTGKSNP